MTTPGRVKESSKTKNQPPSSCRSTGDTQCVDAPASSACLRNCPQNKRQQHPNHRHSGIFISRKRKENIRNLRRKAGMPPHWRECEAPLRRTQRDGADETIGRILSHPLLWSPRAADSILPICGVGVGGTLEVKKNDVIPEFSFRGSGRKMSGISAARRACLPIGENAKRRFAGHSAAARMKQFPAVVFRHGCRRVGCPE